MSKAKNFTLTKTTFQLVALAMAELGSAQLKLVICIFHASRLLSKQILRV